MNWLDSINVNGLDLAFLFILFWAVQSSLRAGLIQEAFTLIGLTTGTTVAGQLYHPLARLLFGESPGNMASAITFLAVLMATWFGIGLLGRLVRETAHWIMLGWLDRLGGLLFGFLKGYVMIAVILILLTRFPVMNTEELIEGSLIAPWISQYTPMIMALLPSDFRRLPPVFGK